MPALSRPPAGLLGGKSELFSWFERARSYYVSQSRTKFEATTLGLALLVGLVVMPALIYVAGRYSLGPYSRGTAVAPDTNLFSLYFDFYKGLAGLRPSCWIVVIGPFVFLSFVRLCRVLLRKV